MRIIVTLPLFIVLSAALPGCQTGSCPELVAYREGLHRLDSSLYAQHKTLMDEAVAKGLRTDVDRQVVEAEIKQAEGQYQSGRKGDAQSTPAN